MKSWQKSLLEREHLSLRRKLIDIGELFNLSSNDYLGFARDEQLLSTATSILESMDFQIGSTGSRLISGNSEIIQAFERDACKDFGVESALFLASGYQANLALFSCLGGKESLVLYDESAHASIRDGLRLGQCKSYKFKHNNTQHLKELLQRNSGNELFVCVESLYSMDGDFAPLEEIALLCKEYQATLIVDEAHAFGLFGQNGLGLAHELSLNHQIIRMIGFGKAAGCSGGLLLGPKILKDYIVNFSRPFIYSTAPSSYQVAFAMASLRLIKMASNRRKQNQQLIQAWHQLQGSSGSSPIVPIRGNSSELQASAKVLEKAGYYIKAVYPPTVKEGNQMLRLCIGNHFTSTILEDVHRIVA